MLQRYKAVFYGLLFGLGASFIDVSNRNDFSRCATGGSPPIYERARCGGSLASQ